MTAELTIEMPARRTPCAEFLDGARRSIPVIVASAPFGALFGALAIDNGFSVFEAVLMSVTVFGGASQMVGIELFGHKIAPWLIVLSIFAVNFRHVLYSAAVGRHLARWPLWQQAVAYFLLTDPQFAEAESRGQREPGREPGDRTHGTPSLTAPEGRSSDRRTPPGVPARAPASPPPGLSVTFRQGTQT